MGINKEYEGNTLPTLVHYNPYFVYSRQAKASPIGGFKK